MLHSPIQYRSIYMHAAPLNCVYILYQINFILNTMLLLLLCSL